MEGNFRFVPYGTSDEWDKLVDSKKWTDRLEAASKGYGFDKLYTDVLPEIRRIIAGKGCFLDYYVDDPDVLVLAEVVGWGYKIDEVLKSAQTAEAEDALRDIFIECGYRYDDLLAGEMGFLSEDEKTSIAASGYTMERNLNDLSNKDIVDYFKDTLYHSCDTLRESHMWEYVDDAGVIDTGMAPNTSDVFDDFCRSKFHCRFEDIDFHIANVDGCIGFCAGNNRAVVLQEQNGQKYVVSAGALREARSFDDDKSFEQFVHENIQRIRTVGITL